MKYIMRIIVGIVLGFVVGAVLNIALSHGFHGSLFPDLREWCFADFFKRGDELNGWARFTLVLPILFGAIAAIRGIGQGILGILGAALLVTVVTFIAAFFWVINGGGVLALFILFALIFGGPVGIILMIFD